MNNASARKKRRLVLVALPVIIATVAIIAGLALLMPKFLNGRAHGIQLRNLEANIRNSGAEFITVTAPYRQRRWRETEGKISKFRRNLAARATYLGLAQSGVKFLNLAPSFGLVSDDDENYRDPVHLSAQGSALIGPAVHRQIVEHLGGKITRTDGSPLRIVLAGDCYSEDLVSALEATDSDTHYLAARAFARADRAIELVFKYPTIYFDNVDYILWLRPEIFLAYGEPPPLNLSPLQTGEGARQMVISVLDDVGYDYQKFYTVRKKFEYPDVAVELGAVTVSDQRITLCAYAARKRERTGIEAIRKGDNIVATVQPLESYLAEHPEDAGAYYWITDDDLLADRYWVHDWARADYTGDKAVSKTGVRD